MAILKSIDDKLRGIQEQIKVILKFDLNQVYKIFYLTDAQLPELIITVEKLEHIKYNLSLIDELSVLGKNKFNSLWQVFGQSLNVYVQHSEYKKYYHDSLIMINDLTNYLELLNFPLNFQSKVIFSILIVQNKIIKL